MSYNLLKGKRGIIFGALNDQSIAWKVAERAVEEGATITLSNTPMAIRMGEVNALAEKLNCQIVPADIPDLSLKTSDPGFSCVIRDHRFQCTILNG